MWRSSLLRSLKKTDSRTWPIILAGGDGTRLARLTTDERGNAIPKQYCSLQGGKSLIEETMARARRLAPWNRICAVVAESHRLHWKPLLKNLPAPNVIVQPQNRGTAHGILLATLSVLERDPSARIIFLPADHYVHEEPTLAGSLHEAAHLLRQGFGSLLLVGIEPEEADVDLGYIVPGERQADGSFAVKRFVEKPEPSMARELIAAGALWNSFIFAAPATALLALLRRTMGSVVDEMRLALVPGSALRPGFRGELAELYGTLPAVDFSRNVIQGAEASLRVLVAPVCGWSDLGSPKRVAGVLRRLQNTASEHVNTALSSSCTSEYMSLAIQHARLCQGPNGEFV
jgi:mannose-1-phosphate guanylyltransferase